MATQRIQNGRRQRPRRRHRGITLVELLVGLALGLFIVATALLLVTGQLRDHRKLLTEGRLMQDLRVATDLVTRDLRRAGHWGGSTAGMWRPGAAPVITNPYAALSPSAAASDAVTFRFSRDTTENHLVDSNEHFGFRLRAGVLEMLLGSGNWQALTDAQSLVVTTFSVTPHIDELSLERFCSAPCPAASTSCPPRQQVRSLAVQLSARATSDASVVRTIRSRVRLRNDPVSGSCGV